jgi:hypothetical protein
MNAIVADAFGFAAPEPANVALATSAASALRTAAPFFM